MNYYRKPINKVVDDVKLKMQLGALTLKIYENNNKIDSLLAVVKNIIKDVSTNLGKIDTNKSDISSNLGKIDTNKCDISSNLGKISDNKINISSNLGKISDNKTNISSNLNHINDIKSILPALEIFKKPIVLKINHLNLIVILFFFKLLEIENNFNVDGKLEINSNIYYKYDDLQKDNHRLQHEYQIFDDKNNLLHKTILNKTNSTDLDFNKILCLLKITFILNLKIITIK